MHADFSFCFLLFVRVQAKLNRLRGLSFVLTARCLYVMYVDVFDYAKKTP